MFSDLKGPIQQFEWGKYIINGEEHSKINGRTTGKGKDLFIVDGKVHKWNEREGHKLTYEMVERVLKYNLDILIIGNGVNGRIEVSKKIIVKLKNNGISEIFVKKTPQALNFYNQFFHDNKKVALFVHGTC